VCGSSCNWVLLYWFDLNFEQIWISIVGCICACCCRCGMDYDGSGGCDLLLLMDVGRVVSLVMKFDVYR